MREEIIQKADRFMCEELMRLAGYKDNNPRMAEYRIEHSRRVAHLAAEIARKEGLDEERLFVAGLLHDIGYSVDYDTREAYRGHGRVGAEIARPFLTELGYTKTEADEMCYGIAIHVDDEAGFPGERTPFTLTVQDADNIDRFDAFRLYEVFQDVDYRNLSLKEQRAFVEKRIFRLKELRELPFGTKTATSLWQEKIDYQLGFCERLLKQIENSVLTLAE